MELTTTQIRAALPGCNLSGDTAEKSYRGVSTDTREDCTGKLFVALRGESFDANEFLDRAAGSGAAGAVIGPSANSHSLPAGMQYFRVSDTLDALKRLGVSVRNNMENLRVVAVTGSNGKSTTKEMIAAVVSTTWRTHATAGNYNNHIGVPLTLLSMPGDTEVLVAELGANHPGEIRTLARQVRPEISVITNIAPAHLEGFGTVEGVLAAKTELFEENLPDGKLIYCGDIELLKNDVTARFANTVSFGLKGGNDVSASELELGPDGAPSFTLSGGTRIRLATPGRHNVFNALAAAATGRALGLDDETIRRGLESVQPMKMRGQLKKIGGLSVLDDSYNANPLSMVEALKTLLALQHDGPRVAVLGQMLELGPEASQLHRQLAADAAGRGLDLVVMVGEHAGEMKQAWQDAGADPGRAFAARDADQAWNILENNLRGGELVLVKGSRGMRLERLIENMHALEGV